LGQDNIKIHASFIRNHSGGIHNQNWAVKLADFVLRKCAGLQLLTVRPRTTGMPGINFEMVETSKQFLGEPPVALEQFWSFLKGNPIFLAQGRAFGCQLGVTREMRQLMEYHFGDEAVAFFKANPMYEIIGATTAFPGPTISIAQFGQDVMGEDCPFVVVPAKTMERMGSA